VQFVKRDTLFFALNETTHALRFAESAARRFSSDVDVLAWRDDHPDNIPAAHEWCNLEKGSQ
jgi:hypothetical protein